MSVRSFQRSGPASVPTSRTSRRPLRAHLGRSGFGVGRRRWRRLDRQGVAPGRDRARRGRRWRRGRRGRRRGRGFLVRQGRDDRLIARLLVGPEHGRDQIEGAVVGDGHDSVDRRSHREDEDEADERERPSPSARRRPPRPTGHEIGIDDGGQPVPEQEPVHDQDRDEHLGSEEQRDEVGPIAGQRDEEDDEAGQQDRRGQHPEERPSPAAGEELTEARQEPRQHCGDDGRWPGRGHVGRERLVHVLDGLRSSRVGASGQVRQPRADRS